MSEATSSRSRTESRSNLGCCLIGWEERSPSGKIPGPRSMFPSTAQLLYLLRLGGSRTWALALILLLTRPIRAAITQHLFSKELLVEKSFGKQQQLRIVGLWKQIFCRDGRKVLSKLSKKDIRANVLRLFSVALSRLVFPMSEINTAKWFSDRVSTFHL